MKTKHKNIPIFIPHLGCPNNCVFCNQRSISGTRDFDINKVEALIEESLKTVDVSSTELQLAYFGGSFTGIDRNDMIHLLALGKKYVDLGAISSIRISTRPDYINRDILTLLNEYGVRSIELGIQSMSNKVLSASGRGHSSEDTKKACSLIRESGCFELVGQMMVSLPFSTPDDDRNTAKEIVTLGADKARIYPTMVFASTPLEEMLNSGIYSSPDLDSSVSLCADIFEIFTEASVEVIRIGLAESDGLHDQKGISAGAYHPAMGELVIGEYYRRIIDRKLKHIGKDILSGKNITVYAPIGSTSKVIGQNGRNKRYIYNEYNVKSVKVIENPDILLYNVLTML
ncbi:MAG: radical SAM protein [Clostridia bacterium]|nr:radical SAM protein [Clostridia bacterium]